MEIFSNDVIVKIGSAVLEFKHGGQTDRDTLNVRSLRAQQGVKYEPIHAEWNDHFQIVQILFDVSFSLFMNK